MDSILSYSVLILWKAIDEKRKLSPRDSKCPMALCKMIYSLSIPPASIFRIQSPFRHVNILRFRFQVEIISDIYKP